MASNTIVPCSQSILYIFPNNSFPVATSHVSADIDIAEVTNVGLKYWQFFGLVVYMTGILSIHVANGA